MYFEPIPQSSLNPRKQMGLVIHDEHSIGHGRHSLSRGISAQANESTTLYIDARFAAHSCRLRRLLHLEWEPNGECRTSTRLTFHCDRTPVFDYNHVVRDRQSLAGTLADWFCRKERIEYLLLYLRRHSATIIGNRHLGAFSRLPSRHLNRSLVRA